MATPIDFQKLHLCLPLIMRQRKPMLLRGPHGIGKSEIVYQLAKIARKILNLKANTKAVQRDYGLGEWELPVVERRASQMPDAGDLMGLPVMDGEVTRFNPMEWFEQACAEPVILFFDEVDRANQDVRQALFELTDSRKIAGQTLHPDTVVIACVNGGEGEQHYVVGEMDPAELDRWTVFDVRPSLEDWIAWAKQDNNVHRMIIEFIKQNRGMLEHNAEFEPNKKYPSRRSWKRLSDTLKGENILENPMVEGEGGKKIVNPALFYITQAYVGQEAAMSFQEFVRTYKQNLTLEDILKGVSQNQLDALEVGQQISLIEKMGESPLLKENLSDKQIENLAKFGFSISHELVMNLFDAISGANPNNGFKIHQVKIDNKSWARYMAQLLGGKISE